MTSRGLHLLITLMTTGQIASGAAAAPATTPAIQPGGDTSYDATGHDLLIIQKTR